MSVYTIYPVILVLLVRFAVVNMVHDDELNTKGGQVVDDSFDALLSHASVCSLCPNRAVRGMSLTYSLLFGADFQVVDEIQVVTESCQPSSSLKHLLCLPIITFKAT